MIMTSILLCFLLISSVLSFHKIPHVSRMRLKMCESNTVAEPTQVFIGNLPFEIGEKQLENLISEKYSSNLQSVKIIKSKETGKSRGFGYLTYSSKEDATKALSNLNQFEIDGRQIKVDLAENSVEKDSRNKPTIRTRFSNDNQNKLFIGNLDFQTTVNDIESLCSNVLGVNVLEKVDIVFDKATSKPRGFGYLHFKNAEDMALALDKLNGQSLNDRNVRIDTVTSKDNPKTIERPKRMNNFQSEYSIYLGNLSWEVDSKIIDEMLTDVVGPGLFSNVRLAVDKETGKSRGFCHVDFKDAESMERALVELEGIIIYGRPLKIDRAQSKTRPTDNRNTRSRSTSNENRYSDSEDSGSINNW